MWAKDGAWCQTLQAKIDVTATVIAANRASSSARWAVFWKRPLAMTVAGIETIKPRRIADDMLASPVRSNHVNDTAIGVNACKVCEKVRRNRLRDMTDHPFSGAAAPRFAACSFFPRMNTSQLR